MIIEFHAIQSFAPANLNRDDTGAPKDCTFGGVQRARVSSQSWKQAMRRFFRESVTGLSLGTRTSRAHRELVQRMMAAGDLGEEVARHRAAVILGADPLGLTLKLTDIEQAGEDDHPREVQTGQLIFFRDADLDALAAVGNEFGPDLDELPSLLHKGSDSKKAGKSRLSKQAEARVREALTRPDHALDVALFGRMIAELPAGNVDAAAQVAHALGTHRITRGYDYYTAIDDIKLEDTEGAGMIGTIEFNASCFYRYATLSDAQLSQNLGAAADSGHVATAVREFTRAFVTAVPSGKQSSFAAHNPPAAVLVVRRTGAPMNLANAFIRPVTPGDTDIADESVQAMLSEFGKLEAAYGSRDAETSACLLSLVEPRVESAQGLWTRVGHVEELIEFAGRA